MYKHLKEMNEYGNTPCIFITNHDTTSILKGSMQLGSRDFISKPMTDHDYNNTNTRIEEAIKNYNIEKAMCMAESVESVVPILNETENFIKQGKTQEALDKIAEIKNMLQ
ncbi:MAG: hypothetical protein GY749_06770 [Desulfobacteraceae bacterium]|nr:hypothetical protein [Desulfobacteraceae bacterium]